MSALTAPIKPYIRRTERNLIPTLAILPAIMQNISFQVPPRPSKHRVRIREHESDFKKITKTKQLRSFRVLRLKFYCELYVRCSLVVIYIRKMGNVSYYLLEAGFRLRAGIFDQYRAKRLLEILAIKRVTYFLTDIDKV